MSSAIRKPSFAFPFALIVLIAQPVTTFCLMQIDREKGPSPIRGALEYTMFFPSTVFDFFVRALTHKSPVMVFGAFWGDIVFGLFLNAVGWAVIAAVFWLIFDAILEAFTHSHLTPM